MDLLNALKNHNNELVKVLIKNGTDLNTQDESNETALIFASIYGEEEIAKILIENGAQLNIQNFKGETALYWAATNGYEEIVKLLVKKGADVNIAKETGETPLFSATIEGFTDIIKLFINNGANVNVEDGSFSTPLIVASQSIYAQQYDILTILLKAGAKPNESDMDGNTALHYVSEQRNNKSAVKLLLDNGADVNFLNEEDKTPIDIAYENKNSYYY